MYDLGGGWRGLKDRPTPPPLRILKSAPPNKPHPRFPKSYVIEIFYVGLNIKEKDWKGITFFMLKSRIQVPEVVNFMLFLSI